jgi:hypothetical protein
MNIKNDLLESFQLFSNPKYTGSEEPVTMIIFSAQGPIVDPPDYQFMGYGKKKDGILFEALGGIDLTDLISTNPEEDEDAFRNEFEQACVEVTEVLKEAATSDDFKAISKAGPVVFALAVEDQANKVLGRIHPDGKFEAPPKK